MSTTMPVVDNRQISPLILTFLIESLALRGQMWINEHHLVSQIASFIAVVSEKQSMAIPAHSTVTYVESVNKLCGTVMLVMDELLQCEYIQKMEVEGPISSRAIKNHYRINIENEYVQKFSERLGCALKYVAHPAYALESSLLEAMRKLCIEERNPLLPGMTPPPAPGAGAGAGARTGRTKTKAQSVATPLAPIFRIHLGRSEDNPRKWYHIYHHEDGRKTCTCPHYTFACSKKGTECKHIKSLEDGDYERLGHYLPSDHEPVTLFNGEIDSDLFTDDIQYVGVFEYRKLEE